MFRHGKTHYTGEFPDLIPEGEEQALGLGKAIGKRINLVEPGLIHQSSPTPRARGSLFKLFEGAGLVTDASDFIGQEGRLWQRDDRLRALDKPDEGAFLEAISETKAKKDAAQASDYFDKSLYYNWDGFWNDAEIVEPLDLVRERFLNNWLPEKLKRASVVSQTRSDLGLTPPVELVAAHFEILQPLLGEIFPDEFFAGTLLQKAEPLRLQVLQTESLEDSCRINVFFRGESVEVSYDFRRKQFV